MVHKFKNKVDNFLFSEMPVDSMDYERKGGCFVTISKGVILTILFVIFGFILGLIVFYTTKHVYQSLPPTSIDEFIIFEEENNYTAKYTITPKHYRLIFNPLLNDTQNQFAFSGNVWITITPNDDNIKTIELDVKNLDINANDVSVFRSRILSDLNFQSRNVRGERSAKLMEGDESTENGESDMLMNSTEWIDSNVTNTSVEKESQEVAEKIEENVVTNTTESIENSSDVSESSDLLESSSITEPSDVSDSSDISEPSVTESTNYNNMDTMWNGLLRNDSMLTEPNPDDQTELEIDAIQFSKERQKLIVTLSSSLRKGHYYIVKVFFSGTMTNDYGLVYKSHDGTEASDNFIAATITDPDHTPALFPCFNNFLKEVTFDLTLIRHDAHQSVSVSKLMRSQKITNYWTLDAYERTTPMRLNNFGFVITDIEAIIVAATPNLMLNTYFRPKLLPSITLIDSQIPSLLRKIELYTNATYPMESISFFGLTNCSDDFIEIKEGLVIASESFFIAHDEADKQNKALTISHVIGKLWFQPWRTVESEDQEWISEALPLQLRLIIEGTHTNNYFDSETMVEKRMESMGMEQSFIEFNLKEFNQHSLDTNWIHIAQSKGLYLLGLLESILTQPVYQLGLQRFFRSNEPTNFFKTFSNLTKDLKIDKLKAMEKSIKEWSQQIGYPLIHIQKNGNQAQIQQVEFGERNTFHFWNTQITLNNQTFWLQNNSTNFDAEDNNWLTVKSNGYFRVNYDDSHWQTILNSLRMDHKTLSTIDRAILMDDALNLAKFNYLNYSIVLQLLERWNAQETEYLPWKAALVNLEYVYQNSIHFHYKNNLDILLRNLTQRTYQIFIRSPLGGFPYKLKILVKKWSCQIFALPDCVADAKREFQNLIVNDTLKRSQRSSTDVEQLYCTAIRFGDIKNWYLVRNGFDPNNNHNYNDALIYSLGCSTDHRILSEYFQLLFDKNYSNHAKAIVRSMNDNQIGRKYALEYLFTNFQRLYQIHGLNTFKALLKGISTSYDYKLFQLFFSNNTSLFTSKDKKSLAEIVNSIKSNLNWKDNFTDEFNTP